MTDALHRRAPGPRTLLYLDQWAFSYMARGVNGYDKLLERLRADVGSGAALCPASPVHRRESIVSDDVWDELHSLVDELSIGISFRSIESIERHEIEAAAAEFSGMPIPRPMWEEAFSTDPQTPREDLFTELFGGRVRVTAAIPPTEPEQDEAVWEKALAERMNATYGELRAEGFTFEQMAEGNLDAILNWKLGPLLDTDRFHEQATRRYADVMRNVTVESVHALENLMARLHMVDWLMTKYPKVALYSEDFRRCNALRWMPTMRYPALLRSALAASPTRRAQAGDESDVKHLMLGLSRCDIATADRSMAHLARQHDLVPQTCTLVSAREGAAAIIAALDARGPA